MTSHEALIAAGVTLLLLVAGYIATHFTALADGLEQNMASVGRWYRWRRSYHGGRGRHLDGGGKPWRATDSSSGSTSISG
jgi:hypothetical protein